MKKNIVITEFEAGVEARPVALLVQKATQFASKVYLEIGNKRINAKSIMGVMSVALTSGTEIVIDAEGPDEAEAILALEKFFAVK